MRAKTCLIFLTLTVIGMDAKRSHSHGHSSHSSHSWKSSSNSKYSRNSASRGTVSKSTGLHKYLGTDIIQISVQGIDARGSHGHSSHSSHSSSHSLHSSESSSVSSKYSSSSVSRGTVSRSTGLSNFNSFTAGATVGYAVGSSNHRSYYYGHQTYSGSCDFGEEVCKATVSQSDIQSANSSVVTGSSNSQIVIYWSCSSSEQCCGLDCCSSSSAAVIICIVTAIFMVVGLACCCSHYRAYRQRKIRQLTHVQEQQSSYTVRLSTSFHHRKRSVETLPVLQNFIYIQQNKHRDHDSQIQ